MDDGIRTKENLEYRIPITKVKEKFPQIRGHIKYAEYDSRGEDTLVVRTECGYYSDDQMRIWKELGETENDDIFVASHLKTKIGAEGKTEEEARSNLIEKVKEYYDREGKNKTDEQQI